MRLSIDGFLLCPVIRRRPARGSLLRLTGAGPAWPTPRAATMRDGEARGPIEPALAGGAALGLLAVALEKITALGIALYLPRHLGLEDYGRYALLMSYLGLFQGLADASLE